jgi:hypothetical protein
LRLKTEEIQFLLQGIGASRADLRGLVASVFPQLAVETREQISDLVAEVKAEKETAAATEVAADSASTNQ